MGRETRVNVNATVRAPLQRLRSHCAPVFQRPTRPADMQLSPRARRAHVGPVRGDDVVRIPVVLRHGVRFNAGLRRATGARLVGLRQDRRHALPAAAAGNAAGRHGAPQHRSLLRGRQGKRLPALHLQPKVGPFVFTIQPLAYNTPTPSPVRPQPHPTRTHCRTRSPVLFPILVLRPRATRRTTNGTGKLRTRDMRKALGT